MTAFAALALPGGGRLAFVRKRQALGDVCRAGFTYIISAKRPYYPCSTGQPIYYRRLQHGERYLVYFTADPPKFVSNLPGLPSKWHPPPNICLLYTSPSPRDVEESRMPSSA